MAKGNAVVVTAFPKGNHQAGIIDGTPKPGVVMQIKAATEPVNGRHTWEVYNRTGTQKDGLNTLIAVLDADYKQGKTKDDAYVSGQLGELYMPIPGDELNMIIENISGTADDYAIGDLLQVIDGTGKLEDAITGTAHNYSQPFVLLETITDPTDDYSAWVMFTGY